MQPISFSVTPGSQTLRTATVSAQVEHMTDADIWEVLIILARKPVPGQALIRADEVEAHLYDSQGQALKLLEGPSGDLVEAGGSLSVSANAHYRFQGQGAPAVELGVSYQGEATHFQIS